MPDDSDPTVAELIAARPDLSIHAMDGLLLSGIPLNAVADALGTPTWVYSADTMRARFGALAAALERAGVGAHIHYAVKANDHLAILRVFAGAGAGADVVSEGELLRVRAAGVAPGRIVFSGVGKSGRELRLAITEDIAQINIESAEELEQVSAIAATLGRTARVALRVNPDIDAGTHAKISTGRAGDKFGIPAADVAALYARAAGLPFVRPVGLAVHIGSQIATMAPYRAAYARVAELVRALRAAGHAVDTLDCGGGLGIGYRDEPLPGPAALAGAIAGAFRDLDVRLIVEPGRWLIGPAGLLLAEVVLVKHAGARRFVVLDAAMNDLVRPSMYDAWHGIVPLGAADAAGAAEPADIVGPICESGDTFARNRALPPLAPGARVAILDAGAYGAVMSSVYNARPLAAAAMIDAGRWAVIRERQPVEALWRDERIPDWLP
ncbi:MAG TPA: diaminopimelate decarboxylase [Acetobacteraceae bacterium]